jgi:hypothetical protein
MTKDRLLELQIMASKHEEQKNKVFTHIFKSYLKIFKYNFLNLAKKVNF